MFDRDECYGKGPFQSTDPEVAREILSEIVRISVSEISESAIDSDREPPVFDPKTRTAPLPDSFKKAYKTYMDAEWWRLALPEEMGGTDAPPSLYWAAAEIVLGANPALWMYSAGPNFARVIHEVGTPEQQRIGQLMVDRRWGATMVLTEPDAGSDVGAGRTRAIEQEDGSWHIEGVKRFITNAEHDLSENIIHFVLARPDGHGPGTRGLSLFLVPKYEFDHESGELGARNGVYATNVEHKMGLKASNTCELSFGGEHPAKGWLLGQEHKGMPQMFKIIEFARMMVGTKAVASLSTGYLNALKFARERIQGPDMTQMGDKASPRVSIMRHPDVRGSLMRQKAHAEGTRALILYSATVQDQIRVKEHEGSDTSVERSLRDLLLPIVKGYSSEKTYPLLSESLQTLGGSGYLQDYPIEQYIRDSKIDTLYEGTTAIQGQDYFFRKIAKDNGRGFGALLGGIRSFLAEEQGGEDLSTERGLLADSVDCLNSMVETLVAYLAEMEKDTAAIYKVGQNTTRLLMVSGDVVIAYLLLRGAATALARRPLGAKKDEDFYAGKIAVAKFFANQVLPGVLVQRSIVERTDGSLMTLPDTAL